jgi:hypothetical protein
MYSSGPCERRFNLRRAKRFNKRVARIIHNSCLLPVLSDSRIENPCYLFRMFWRMSLCCCDECLAHGERDFIGGDLGQTLMTRDRAGTHVIEHLVDGLANPMRGSLPPHVPAGAQVIMTKVESRGMT